MKGGTLCHLRSFQTDRGASLRPLSNIHKLWEAGNGVKIGGNVSKRTFCYSRGVALGSSGGGAGQGRGEALLMRAFRGL